MALARAVEVRAMVYVQGRKVWLATLTSDLVTERYVQWLADLEVNQYMEVRWDPPTIDELVEYAEQMIDEDDCSCDGDKICDKTCLLQRTRAALSGDK